MNTKYKSMKQLKVDSDGKLSCNNIQGVCYTSPEIEGGWNHNHGINIRGDSSVNNDLASNGNESRDMDCECYDSCCCECCMICNVCDNSSDDCTCDSCRVCGKCGESIDRNKCTCITDLYEAMTHRRSILTNVGVDHLEYESKPCECNPICEICIEEWRRNNIQWSCSENGHEGYRCDRDCDCSCDCDNSDSDGLVGEASPTPCSIKDSIAWVDDNYPDNIDGTCGCHLHVSFNDDMLSYSKLMSPTFWRFFMRRMEDWGHKNNINPDSRFWHRLKGGNHMTQKIFRPITQIGCTGKDVCRYSHLNFCYNIHGTLEIRLLPMFQKKSLTLNALQYLVDTINIYLLNHSEEKTYIMNYDGSVK